MNKRLAYVNGVIMFICVLCKQKGFSILDISHLYKCPARVKPNAGAVIKETETWKLKR